MTSTYKTKEYISLDKAAGEAREALIKSKEYVKKELYGKGSVLNDDGEEAALDVLGPAESD